MAHSVIVTRPSQREVIFSRTLDAPRLLVWQSWTELRHLHEWFGPDGFTLTTHEFNLAVGGVWRLIMHGPDGTDYPTRIVFTEIDPPSRLVYENSWDLPGAPVDFTVVVTMEEAGSETTLALKMSFADESAVKTAVERYGILDGGCSTFERLAQHLERPV